MGLIENYNCEGLCVQEYCDDHYTHFFPIVFNEVSLLIPVCEKHYWVLLESLKLRFVREAVK